MTDPKRCPLADRVYPLAEIPSDGTSAPAIRHREDCGVDLVGVRRRQPGEVSDDTSLFRQPDGGFAPRRAEHAGPARVTSEAFRSGWERMFGGKQEVGQA